MQINEIRLNDKNPRLIKGDKFKQLVKSIKAFPKMMELRPIVIDDDGVIIGGNMRYQAIKVGLKMTEIPDAWVIRASALTEEQKREFVIKDNVGFGEWDFDILANEWDLDELKEWGLDLPGMEGPEEKPEAKDDGFQVPEHIETDIIPGDVIEIGSHRLICADSRHTDQLERLFAGHIADLIVTDPPYNVDYSSKNEMLNRAANVDKSYAGKRAVKPIENDKMSDSDFYQFLLEAFTAAGAYLKPGGAVYVWHADMKGLPFRQAFIDSGIDLKQCLIWVKNELILGRNDYHWKHEPCLYGWKPGAAHYFTDDRTNTTVIDDNIDLKKLSKAELLNMLQTILSDKTPTSVLRYDKPQRSEEHPTMKPVPLFGHLIENSSKPGEIVADFFGGSGTTMVAAHQLGRRAFIAEKDPNYCQVIVNRMTQLDPAIEIRKNGQPWNQNVKLAG